MLRRAAGRVLREHGAVAVGPSGMENLREGGLSGFVELWMSLSLQQCVLWFDNYVRPRSYVDPARGFLMFDCTAFAVLQVERLPPFSGMPKHSDLLDLRRRFVNDLGDYFGAFGHVFSTVQNMTFSRDNSTTGCGELHRCESRVVSSGVPAQCVAYQTGLVRVPALGWAM